MWESFINFPQVNSRRRCKGLRPYGRHQPGGVQTWTRRSPGQLYRYFSGSTHPCSDARGTTSKGDAGGVQKTGNRGRWPCVACFHCQSTQRQLVHCIEEHFMCCVWLWIGEHLGDIKLARTIWSNSFMPGTGIFCSYAWNSCSNTCKPAQSSLHSTRRVNIISSPALLSSVSTPTSPFVIPHSAQTRAEHIAALMALESWWFVFRLSQQLSGKRRFSHTPGCSRTGGRQPCPVRTACFARWRPWCRPPRNRSGTSPGRPSACPPTARARPPLLRLP